MSYTFPSAEWTQAYKAAVNDNEGYRRAAAKWTYGKVAMVVSANPEIGITEDTAMLLDVHEGICRQADYLPAAQAIEQASFVIVASYERWKKVVERKLEPIMAMMQGQLKLTKGSLPTMLRFVSASRQLVESASSVPTDFIA